MEEEVLVVLEDTTPANTQSLLDEKEQQNLESMKVINPSSDLSKPLLDIDNESEQVADQLNQSEPVCKEQSLSEPQSILPDHHCEQKNHSTPVSGPCRVARFDYEGAEEDELTFSKGDVIALTEVIGQDWGRGQVRGRAGIFPLSFTEEEAELLAPSPGKHTVTQTMTEERVETPDPNEEWAVALYDFPGQTAEDLSFLKGALISVTQRVDAEWSRGRLDGREGLFPSAFTHACTAQPMAGQTAVVGVAKALFDFSAESEDELTLKTGDVVTGLVCVDDDWFLGTAGGRHGLVPKNYISLLT